MLLNKGQDYNVFVKIPMTLLPIVIEFFYHLMIKTKDGTRCWSIFSVYILVSMFVETNTPLKQAVVGTKLQSVWLFLYEKLFIVYLLFQSTFSQDDCFLYLKDVKLFLNKRKIIFRAACQNTYLYTC